MPNIRCVKCGEEIIIDAYSCPYEGEVACPKCLTPLQVYMGLLGKGTIVKRKYPSFEELEEISETLSKIEKNSIQEASLSLGSGAYTGSELMALRTLESILRRTYEVDDTLGKLIERMESDNRLSDLKGILSYFKDVRNRIAHPEKLSSKLEAESTFQMTKRLLIEIVKKAGQ